MIQRFLQLLILMPFILGVQDEPAAQSTSEETTPSAQDDERQRRKQQATEIAKSFHIQHVAEDGKPKDAVMVGHSILNWTDTVHRQEGTLWTWTYQGRPITVIEIYRRARFSDRRWAHTMISTSTGTLLGTKAGNRRWMPKQPGVVFKPIPDVGKPSAKRALRLSQMRRIADRFSAHVVDIDRTELRLLAEPIFRYEKDAIVDGAMFVFVLGSTNPEVLLLIEATSDSWRYALARCSANEQHAALDEDEVWVAPQVPGWNGAPDKAFWHFYVTYAAIGNSFSKKRLLEK